MNWQKQNTDKPLFENVLWDQPQNRKAAGKLLVLGGSAHGFAAPASAYMSARKAGIGSVRVLLPRALKKTVGKILNEADYLPSTPSGSFARLGLGELLEASSWSDGVLLAGDFGRNSETAILLESFIQKYPGKITASQDALDYFIAGKSPILIRDNTLIVINLGKLQKLAKFNRATTAILHNMSVLELAGVLADWTNSTPASFITKHADNIVVASQGQVSITPHSSDDKWQIDLAAYASVWFVQQPSKPFEALTTAVWQSQQKEV